jgi:hypothetical protein
MDRKEGVKRERERGKRERRNSDKESFLRGYSNMKCVRELIATKPSRYPY